ncbi:MAG: hypothetical protein ACRD2K_05075 [Terriglobales bacterium]
MESFSFEAAVRNTFRVLSLVVMLLLAADAGSQSKPAPPSASPELTAKAVPSADPQFPRPRRTPEEDRFKIEHEREMARKRNQARQAALKKDTDKLLQLATQLKEYVDKTNENMLSLDVIRKAEEIEKLSKSVKDKMKADEYYPAVGTNPNDPR